MMLMLTLLCYQCTSDHPAAIGQRLAEKGRGILKALCAYSDAQGSCTEVSYSISGAVLAPEEVFCAYEYLAHDSCIGKS